MRALDINVIRGVCMYVDRCSARCHIKVFRDFGERRSLIRILTPAVAHPHDILSRRRVGLVTRDLWSFASSHALQNMMRETLVVPRRSHREYFPHDHTESVDVDCLRVRSESFHLKACATIFRCEPLRGTDFRRHDNAPTRTCSRVRCCRGSFGQRRCVSGIREIDLDAHIGSTVRIGVTRHFSASIRAQRRCGDAPSVRVGTTKDRFS